jgi:hypothetical protein
MFLAAVLPRLSHRFIRPVMEQASTNLLCVRKYKTKMPIQNASA